MTVSWMDRHPAAPIEPHDRQNNCSGCSAPQCGLNGSFSRLAQGNCETAPGAADQYLVRALNYLKECRGGAFVANP
jgi:hypothetical protein